MIRKLSLILIGAASLGVVVTRVAEPPTVQPIDQSLDLPAIPKAAAWERAQWHVQKRLGDGMDVLPMNALEPARLQMQSMSRSSAPSLYAKSFSDGNAKAAAAWEALGPNEKGGRTRRIVFDSKGVQYAAGVSGGVWRYESGRWSALGDRLVNLNVGALAIDPTADNVLYAGTGELYRRTNRPYSSMSGAGIFKTTNAGEDWVQLESTLNDNFLYVSDIVVSPNDSSRIYAATNTGVWQSNDGGATFTQSLSTDNGSGNQYEGCTDLAIREDRNTDWVIATCSSRSTDDRYYLPGLLPATCNGPCDGRIYLNRDAAGGGNWQVTLSESGMGRTSVAVFDADPRILYALSASTVPGPDKNGDGIGDYDNGLHAVFRSDNGGQSWTATLRNTSSDPVSTWMLSFAWQARTDGQTPYGAGWYNQAIAVDPLDSNVVWVGGMQLYRSDDGGESFGLMSNYFGDANDPGTLGPAMHPDIHALEFDANGDLWIGNDGGVWLWASGSGTPDMVNDGYRTLLRNGAVYFEEVTGFTTTQFYHGSVSPDGSVVIGGMQDNGTDGRGLPFIGDDPWMGLLGGDGAISAYDASGPYIYVSAQNFQTFRFNPDFSFENIGAPARQAVPAPDDLLFITPYILDPTDPTRLYMAGKRLYRGTNRGEIWGQASAGFGTGFRDKASAIAASPTRQGWVLIGTGNAIYRTEVATLSAQSQQLASTSPRTGWVSSLTFDPNDEMIAYATYSSFGGDHVWKSEDGGKTFFAIDGVGEGRLPDVPVHSLAVHPGDPQYLYIGTDLGVFFTADGGDTWQVEETGFGGAIVEHVVINQPQNQGTSYLFAFTYGRGVWRAPLAEVDGLSSYTVSSAVNGFWYDEDEPGHGLQVQLIDQNGERKALVAWYVYDRGQPLWLIGVGGVDRDRIVVPMTVTQGTGFGDAFDPDQVIREEWGDVELIFSSDNDVAVRWQSAYNDGEAGTLAMNHLSSPVTIEPSESMVGLCSSGTYWNPVLNGQGILIDTVLVDGEPSLAWSWYSYRDGQQLWLVGTGAIQGNTVVSEAFVGNAGEFPPLFKANEADVESWGTVEFEFSASRDFALRWSPVNQPEGSGEEVFTQLAFLADQQCAPAASENP